RGSARALPRRARTAEIRALVAANVAFAEQCRDQARLARNAALLTLDDDTREPRVQREVEHAPAGVAQRALAVDRAEIEQQLFGCAQARRRWRREPSQITVRAQAGAVQREQRLRQVGSRHFGQVVLGTAFEIAARVEAQDAARPRTPGATGALHG